MKKNTLVVTAAGIATDNPSPRRLIRSTTVLCVRRDNKVVMAGDGQAARCRTLPIRWILLMVDGFARLR